MAAVSFRKFIHDALMDYRVKDLFPPQELKVKHINFITRYPQYEDFIEARLVDVLAYSAAQYMFGGANAEERAKRAYECVKYIDNMRPEESLKQATVYIAKSEADV